MEKQDLIERQRVLTLINNLLQKEELLLRQAKTEYNKRLSSYRIVILRDMYDNVKSMPN